MASLSSVPDSLSDPLKFSRLRTDGKLTSDSVNSLSLYRGQLSPGDVGVLPQDSAVGRLGRLISSGRVWTVYEGHLSFLRNTTVADAIISSPIANKQTSISTMNTSQSTSFDPHGSPLSSFSKISSSPSDYDSVVDVSTDTSLDSSESPSPIEVVFKFALPALHRNLPKDQLDYGEYNPIEALAAVKNEADLYSRDLLPLQGVVVPRFYGLFQCEGVWLMVLGRLDQPLLGRRPLSDLSSAEK